MKRLFSLKVKFERETQAGFRAVWRCAFGACRFLLLSLLCALIWTAPALAAVPLPLTAEVLTRPAPVVGEGLPALLWVGLGILSAAGVYELRKIFN